MNEKSMERRREFEKALRQGKTKERIGMKLTSRERIALDGMMFYSFALPIDIVEAIAELEISVNETFIEFLRQFILEKQKELQ